MGRTEAETLTIANGFAIKSNPHPSNGAYLEAKSGEASASGVFDGGAGYYDLTVGYFDETDGVSQMEVLVNGAIVDSFEWNGTFGNDKSSPASRAEYLVGDLWLAPGDLITLRGMGDGGEPLRTDYIDIAVDTSPPPGGAFVIEAEAMEIVSGFKVVSNGKASGDAYLQHVRRGTDGDADEARAAYTFDRAGTFDMTIGYFDESDGVSSMRVLLNGVEIDRFDWDSRSGGRRANEQSQAERVISNLTVSEGDRLELVGHGDGREPLRTDFLRFEPATPAPRATPDLWYEDEGEVIVALNDGAANFTERATGIMVGDADILSGDFDGDGDMDFLRVAVSRGPVPTATPDEIDFDIETTLFENDGAGHFAMTLEGTFTLIQPVRDSSVDFFFKAHAAADVDGDGDVDFVAMEDMGESFFLLGNNGSGLFSLAARSHVFQDPDSQVLLGDLDGNADLDMVILNDFTENDVVVYLNDGTGVMEFSTSASPGAESYGDGQIIDLDGDGFNDILYVAAGEGKGIYSITNDGSGGSRPGGRGSFTPDEEGLIGSFEAANFDRDGQIEIASAGAGGGATETGFRLFDVVTTPESTEFVLKSFDPSITGLLVANGDFDLDGDNDLLIVPRDTVQEMTLLVNDGDGNFSSAGVVIPPFVTSEGSFAPAVNVAFIDDSALLA
ncbi:FG-GAP repeat domain-containing protein [Limimaricola sp. AA108-03]|uniref:FG-GAP repeat domain-containing protein n=1 Tax=Limimaricola sp. AA108-03 TaxID=3425945 RepID=UPI003D77DA9E